MRRARVLLAVASLALPTACGEAPSAGPAAQCAEVVRIHENLQGGVEISGQPVRTSEGGVEIEYRGTGPMNIPVQGAAACSFAVGGGDTLTLIDASVDGMPLDAAEIDAIRRELDERE